ncbi:MAG TPA: histidinol-phosphate transaminase [Candidatus Methylomirabilis sp.]|nr:histidinol-phosphate transaminase [Candidatus Methylomirabilis sp.]
MKTQLPTRQAILDRRTYEPPGEGRADKLRLDFNENTAGCSPAVRRALAKLTPRLLSMYPEYERGTRRLARHFQVAPEELLLTNGGDDALRLFFDAFVDAGTSVVICEPTFPMYRYWGEVVGAKIEAYRYSATMEFPLEAVLQALAGRPRVLFVCNPNNPTGTLLEKSAIERILHAATHTAVVLDEAYAEFSGITVIPWIEQYPHLFIVRTFSKAAGLAGLRLGAIIACADSLAILRRATAPFPVNVAALAAAEAAVGDSRTMKLYMKNILRTRSWFEKELHKLNVKTYPSAGNFLLVDFGPPASEMCAKLRVDGVLLRDRSDIGVGHVRVSIGTQKEMELLLKLIQRYQKVPVKS